MTSVESQLASDDERDLYWMERALALAQRAAAIDEVPVGAVLVLGGEAVGEGWNQMISACDPTAHAEMVAIRAAAAQLGNYRLVGSTLYATLEPCAMCAGAIIHARVRRVAFGAMDPRAGAAGTIFNLLQSPSLNHRAEVSGGVLSEECGALLRSFFRVRRARASTHAGTAFSVG